jgi:hypothetical protein
MSQKIYSDLDVKGSVTISTINSATTDTDKFLVSDGGTIKYRTGTQVLSDLGVSGMYVPYTGATGNVDLGTHTLLAKDLIINHSSGSGVAASITKNGSGEALTVIKGSGSGNAMSVTGGLTSLVNLSLSTVANATGDFLTHSGGVINKRTPAQVLSDIGAQAAGSYLTTETDTLASVTGRGATTNTSISVGPDLTVYPDNSFNYTASRIRLYSHDNYRGAGVHMSGVNSTWFAGTPYTDFSGGYIVSRTSTANDETSAQYSNALLRISSTGSVTASADMRAPIFYDSDNTSYYVNPAGASILNGLKLVSSGDQASGDDYTLWIQGSSYDWGVGVDKSSADYGFKWSLASSHSYGLQGVKNGTEYFRVGTDLMYHDTQMRAPIFYDYNNTGYYLDPAATSNLYNITANSFVKSGGTAAQILAADGSVITAGSNITISGGVISSTGGAVYTHPAYTARNIDTSGAQVIDIITSDAIGSVTNITTRTMTLGDLGYTGATNANYYVLPFTDNSGNWNTAYSWGNHAGLYASSSHTHTFDSLTAKTSGTGTYQTSGEFIQNNGKYVRDSYQRTVSGRSDLYPSGTEGWYTAAQITLSNNCSGAVLYGTLYDNRYNGADSYQIAVVARAECDFTSNNQSHYVNVGCTILGSTNYTNYRSKIRVVLTTSTTDNRTYQLQFFETAWNSDTWQLESNAWTIYNSPQTASPEVGTPLVNYVSNQNADYQRANTATYSPIYYDADDTGYYLNPASNSLISQLSIGSVNNSYTLYNNGSSYFNGSVEVDDTLYVSSGYSARAPIFYDRDNTGYYIDPASTSNLNALNLAGDLSFGSQTATWITSNVMADSIGWNSSYGVYIGSNTLGYSSYIRGNGTFTNNTGTHNLLHADNYTTYTDPRLYRGYSSSGDFQTLQSTAGTVRFDQIGVTGSWSNAPGGYTYGGALSLRGDSFGMQLWGSHTGDFYFKTQWNNDQYSGWREVIHSANIGSFAASTSHTHTFDSLISKSSGTGTYQTNGDFRAPIFYDSNNTTYYLDPAGASVIRKTSIVATGSGWDDGLNLYSADTINRWNVLVDDGATDSLRFAFNNTERFRIGSGGDVTSLIDHRAPIFYDSNNTGYYLNPNGISSISQVYSDNLSIFSGKITLGSNSSGSYNGNTMGLTINSTAEIRSTSAQNAPALTFHYEGIATKHLLMNSSGEFNFVSPTNENSGVAVVKVNNNLVWHAGNDGSGSGLDADTLDGLHASSFLTSYSETDTLQSVTSRGNVTSTPIILRTSYPYLQFEDNVTGSVKYAWQQLGVTLGGGGASGGGYFTTFSQDKPFGWSVGSNLGVMTIDTVGNVQALTSSRAPIFYDSNNTSYYADPASTSVFNGLTVSGYELVRARTQGNWAGSGVIDNVVGLLAWKNYGSSHVIFDASNGTTPSGTACSSSNPQNNWTGTYPTLMGWNGANTYGVRVDSARVADSAGSAGSVDFNNLTNKTGGTGTYQTSGDFRAPIFYDSANTGYYLDLNGTSNIYRAVLDRLTIQQNVPQIDFVDNDQGETRYIHCNGGSLGFLGNTGSWILRTTNSAAEVYGAMYADIYYDRNDTSYYGDFASTSRQYQAISFGDSSRYSAINTTINGAGAGDKLILYGGASNYDARLLVGADYDMLFKSQGNTSGKGSFKFYSGSTTALAMLIDASQNTTVYGSMTANSFVKSGGTSAQYLMADGSVTTGSGSVAWTSVTGKPSNIFYYQGFGLDSNTMDSNSSGFTYANNAPYNGPVARFSAGGGYDLWLNADYGGGTGLAFRTRNGDTGTFNAWRYPALYNVNVNSGGALYASIYYDQNNTAYYLDPASDSNLNTGNLAGRWKYSNYLVSNNEGGLMGSYNITGTAAKCIWTIGESWPLGNMYGLAYEYDNSYYHHLALKNNGTTYARLAFGGEGAYFTGSVTSGTDFRAPIFYDTNNTGYYVDPASTSNLYDLQITGTSNKYLYINPGNGYEAMVRYNGGSGSGWYVGKRTANQTVNSSDFHFFSEAAGMTVAGIDVSGNIFATQSFRAGVFYDLDNTAYYVNPNFTSNLLGLTVANTISGSVTGNSGTVSSITGNTGLMVNSLVPPANIDGLTTTNFRSTLFGTTSNGWQISTARWNNVPAPLSGLNQYSTMLAWSGSDTQGFLAMDYNTPAAIMGGGNANNINWSRRVLLEDVWTNNKLFSSNGDIYGIRFYDTNNTSYYVDPASTSVLNTLNMSFNNNSYGSALNVTNSNTGSQAIAGLGMSAGSKFGSINMFASGYMDLLNQDTTNGGIQFRPRSAVSMYIDNISSTSRVTIGTGNTASHPLRVTQQVSNVSIYADYDIVAYSDQSVKENIRPIENVLDRVNKSRGVLYDRIDSGEKDNIGFIAQELEIEFPELVVTNEDNTKAVKYQNAVAVLFEAVKEQQKQIEELKELVNKLITK